MPITISHYQWMKETDKGIFSIRSSELKAIDEALLWYAKHTNQRNLNALRAAMEEWIHKEGSNWRTSGRNKTGFVEKLYTELMEVPGRKSGEDMVAVSALRDESRVFTTDLFAGKQLDWRPGILAKLKVSRFTAFKNTASVTNDLNGVTHGGIRNGIAGLAPRSGASPGAGADFFVKSMVPAEYLLDVTTALASHLPTFMKELGVAMTPYLGVVAAGGGALLDACKLGRDTYRSYNTRKHMERSLAVDAPQKAMQGIINIIEKEAMINGMKMSLGMGEFTMKLAGVAADFGTATTAAIGLGASLAKFGIFLGDLVNDVMERRKANEMMRAGGNLDSQLFVESPILGAYLVCCAPTSVLTNTVFDRFFVQGWRGEVERAVKQHHEPIKEQARRLIQEHRFWIPALQNYPGILTVNKKKLKEMEARKGKPGTEGFGHDNMPAALKA
ncbi:hypothetical protein NA78x_002403 [Anatilimnocola sp. NA78]|uniref:hypothetical protein n=1 Tax=Anatilimnocola sp. NA78 TaxID=3415683 RepID=UPI003CE4FCA2